MVTAQVVQVAGPRGGPRSRGPAYRAIVPGAGGTAPVAFGSTRPRRLARPKKKKGKSKVVRGRVVSSDCWNAFSPQHLTLPRAVGEYTVTRGTRQISTSDKLIIVGTFQYSDDLNSSGQGGFAGSGHGRNWSDVVALSCNDLSATPSASNWAHFKMPMLESGLGPHAQVCPSACSVQVMNGNSLQLTNGMLYIGKMKVQPLYAGDATHTSQHISDNFVSYMAPRLCAAAKLALKGVQSDAHPLNMNRLADFTQIYRGFPAAVRTPDGDYIRSPWARGLSPAGWTPIVIYNPDGVEVNLLVCHEYRTRFELFNPACASHKHHKPSTDGNWANMVQQAASLGSGVLDIADLVAKSGLMQRIPQFFEAL